MTADDHLIYAQAKDRLEATKEFEAAVGEGKAAALQEKVSGDSQSPSYPNWKVANLPAYRSLQNFPGFYPCAGKNQDQDSGTRTDARSSTDRV